MRATLRRCMPGVMLCVLVYVPAHTRADEGTADEASAPQAASASVPAEAAATEAAATQAAAQQTAAEGAAPAPSAPIDDGKSIEVGGKKLDALAAACLFGFVFAATLSLARVVLHLRRQMMGKA